MAHTLTNEAMRVNGLVLIDCTMAGCVGPVLRSSHLSLSSVPFAAIPLLLRQKFSKNLMLSPTKRETPRVPWILRHH